MNKACGTLTGMTAALLAMPAFAGEWVSYNQDTSQRLIADASLGTNDVQEKDYAWGDVDRDGDIDLVCVRKQPFTSTGRYPNVLFLNEGIADGRAINGVLVDRTLEYATDADDGGQGFFDPTNDRDVVLADVNDDEWLDIITATTLGEGLPKTISHPRVYINKGEIDGEWQGFRYEEARTPQFFTISGTPTPPRFCSVDAGDVTGDGFPDLYFGDYDSGGPGLDVNDRLLINDGTGFFTDSLQTRMTSEMLLSAFGTSVAIRDMNNDGVLDVVKDTGLNSPTRVSVSYNDPANEGFFDRFTIPYNGGAPYFVTVGELNNDGKLDMVIVDDGTDRYLLNTGNNAQGEAQFLTLTFPAGPSAGFGGNAIIDDLNNDGFNDVLIADVDVDISGCNRRLHIYRNLGNLPNVTLTEQGSVLPTGDMTGTHDVAVFDLNGDGWLDLVVGRCTGTDIWINDPPVGIVFQYPDGLPGFLTPDEPYTFGVEVTTFGGGKAEPGSGKLFYSVNDAPFVEGSMIEQLPNVYEATIPGVSCTDQVRFYVTAELVGGGMFSDPPSAPASTFFTVAAEGTEVTFEDDMEDDVSGWTVTDSPGLTSGTWEAVDPNGTLNSGIFAAPEDDATQGAKNVTAFVTENGPLGGGASANDVDGGSTTLTSPVIDLDGSDATISYARWMYCDDEGTGEGDSFETEVTNDGVKWVSVHSTTGTNSAWQSASFLVSDYVEPTATIQVRFIAKDEPNNSITEAGIDNFLVERLICGGAPCPADFDGNGEVGFDDFTALLASWGPCKGCPADLDGNGEVGFDDFTALLASWGPCP